MHNWLMSYLLGRWGLKLELVGDWHQKNWGVFLHAHTQRFYLHVLDSKIRRLSNFDS